MRLTLAFALVVLAAVGAVALLIRQTPETEFRQYITPSGMTASGSGVEELIACYERHRRVIGGTAARGWVFPSPGAWLKPKEVESGPAANLGRAVPSVSHYPFPQNPPSC